MKRTLLEIPPGKFLTCLTHLGVVVAANPGAGATSPTMATIVTTAIDTVTRLIGASFPRRIASDSRRHLEAPEPD